MDFLWLGMSLEKIRPKFLLVQMSELSYRELSGLKFHDFQVQITSLCSCLEVFAINIMHVHLMKYFKSKSAHKRIG